MGALLAQFQVASGGPFQALAPGGSARYRSYIFPEPLGVGGATPISGGQPGSRGNIANANTILSSAYGGGVASPLGVVNQHGGILITTTGAAGLGLRMQGQINQTKTSRSTISPTWDDTHCLRVWANLACSSGSVAGNDQGLFMVRPGGTLQRIFADVAQGFGFQIGLNGVVDWVTRGPNGLVTTHLTANPFDVTKHHTYEMFIVGSSPTSDAYLIALIDGVPQSLPFLSRSWATGSNLTPNTTISNECNLVPQATADGHVLNATFHIHQLGIVWGPTLASLY